MSLKIMMLVIGTGIGSLTIYADDTTSAGAELYADCEVCHGEYAQGDEDFGAPKLSGQHGWYLITQLTNFRDSLRGIHADNDNG